MEAERKIYSGESLVLTSMNQDHGPEYDIDLRSCVLFWQQWLASGARIRNMVAYYWP
jgi:hypothetical protein